MSALLDRLSPGAFATAAARTFARFYLPLGSAIAWAGVTIFGGQLSGTLQDRLLILLLLGLFLLLAAKLFAERMGWRAGPYLALSAGAFGLLTLKVFTIPDISGAWTHPDVLFLGFAVVGLVMVAPFLPAKHENEALWRFNYASLFSAAFGLLVATILGAGLTAALALTDMLVTGGIFEDAYGYVWIVAFSVVWPWQTLAGAPVEFGKPEEVYCPRWLALITSWLLVPLAALYLAIIHVYAVKILVEWELPEGEIGWMVVGYASFGVAVHILAYPLRETGNLLVRRFYRHFYHALVVPIVLLAIGVSVRVDAYGVTEARYTLVLLAVWMAGTGLYFTLRRNPRLVVVPLSVTVMLAAAAFGPWGAASVSLRSQMGQLETLLAAHGLLVDGRIVEAEDDIDVDDNKRIGSVVIYLRERGRLAAIKPWFEDSDLDFAKDPGGADILAAMGLRFIGEWQTGNEFSYGAQRESRIDLRAFDVYHYSNLTRIRDTPLVLESGDDSYRVWFDQAHARITIDGPGGESLELDIAPVVAQLRRESGDYIYDVDGRLMTIDGSSARIRVRLYIESLSGSMVDGEPDITSLQATILIGRE